MIDTHHDCRNCGKGRANNETRRLCVDAMKCKLPRDSRVEPPSEWVPVTSPPSPAPAEEPSQDTAS